MTWTIRVVTNNLAQSEMVGSASILRIFRQGLLFRLVSKYVAMAGTREASNVMMVTLDHVMAAVTTAK